MCSRVCIISLSRDTYIKKYIIQIVLTNIFQIFFTEKIKLTLQLSHTVLKKFNKEYKICLKKFYDQSINKKCFALNDWLTYQRTFLIPLIAETWRMCSLYDKGSRRDKDKKRQRGSLVSFTSNFAQTNHLAIRVDITIYLKFC